METPPSAPPHQFQAQNAQYPPPPDSAQYGPVLHQSQPPSQTPAATLPPEPKPTTAQPPKERTRHSSACFPCAKRKVKCDRDVKNPCSNCLKRDQGHLCEVKSHKDRITHHRVSDPGARDVHRDKRPKFEPQAYQNTFRSNPASSNGGYGPTSADEAYNLSPPQAQMIADYGPSDYKQPRPHRASLSFIARKSDEEAKWDAIEELLPQKKDLLKYIGTYRSNGPHFINPVTTDCDVFESQACMLLTEMDTPQIRDRLCDSNPNAEIELTRLARLLAVLATGARIEDSDPQAQAAIAQDYVRRSFRCLQLANYLLRPITETIETLLLLSQELLNEHQPVLSWTVIGTSLSLAQLLDSSSSFHQNGPYPEIDVRVKAEYAYPILQSATKALTSASRAAITNAALQDTVISSLLNRLSPAQLSALHQHSTDSQYSLDLPTTLSQLYALIPDAALKPTQPSHHQNSLFPQPSSPYHPDHLPQFTHHLDAFTRRFRTADIANCKSIRDRYEHYTFRLHVAHVSALVAKPALGERGYTVESQDTTVGRTLENAHTDTLHAFLDFSSISNLPPRTHQLTHFALTSALTLLSVAQSPESVLVSATLPRLLQTLESSMGVLSKRHAEAVGVTGRVVRDLGNMEGDHGMLRVPPEDVRRAVTEALEGLGRGDEGGALGIWGLC